LRGAATHPDRKSATRSLLPSYRIMRARLHCLGR
jgi:hypothetical protein